MAVERFTIIQWPLMHCLATLIVVYQICLSEAATGRRFPIAFMQNVPDESPVIGLTVYNPELTDVEVTVKFFGMDSETNFKIYLSPSTWAETITLNSSLMLEGATKHTKSIRIDSDKSIQVQAYYSVTGTKLSAGGTLVLPKRLLKKKYTAATHCERRSCIIVVLAAENNADVTIKLRLSGNGTVAYGADRFGDNDEIDQKLKDGESMQLMCTNCDMTGTSIKSDKKIAVFSGGEYTTILGSPKRDMVMEQMLPNDYLGTKYVLGSTFSSNASEIVKIVPLEDDTTFFYDGACHETVDDREVFTFERRSGDLLEVVADKQILVARFIDITEGSSDVPDAVMNVPLPVFQWHDSYHVYVPSTNVTNKKRAIRMYLVKYSDALDPAVMLESSQVFPENSVNSGTYTMMMYNITGNGGVVYAGCVNMSCKSFQAFVVWNAPARSWSIPLLETLDDFSSQNSDADEVDRLCLPTTTTTLSTTTAAAVTNAATTAETSTLTTTDDATTTAITTPTTTIPTTADVPTATTTIPTTADVPTSTTTTHSDTTTSTVPTTTTVTGDATTKATAAAPAPGRRLWNVSCCNCARNPPPSTAANVTAESRKKEEEELVTSIEKKLTEDKTHLSSYVRTKESSKDDRSSSRVIGWIGIAMFVFVFGTIVGLDLITLIRYLTRCPKR